MSHENLEIALPLCPDALDAHAHFLHRLDTKTLGRIRLTGKSSLVDNYLSFFSNHHRKVDAAYLMNVFRPSPKAMREIEAFLDIHTLKKSQRERMAYLLQEIHFAIHLGSSDRLQQTLINYLKRRDAASLFNGLPLILDWINEANAKQKPKAALVRKKNALKRILCHELMPIIKKSSSSNALLLMLACEQNALSWDDSEEYRLIEQVKKLQNPEDLPYIIKQMITKNYRALGFYVVAAKMHFDNRLHLVSDAIFDVAEDSAMQTQKTPNFALLSVCISAMPIIERLKLLERHVRMPRPISLAVIACVTQDTSARAVLLDLEQPYFRLEGEEEKQAMVNLIHLSKMCMDNQGKIKNEHIQALAGILLLLNKILGRVLENRSVRDGKKYLVELKNHTKQDFLHNKESTAHLVLEAQHQVLGISLKEPRKNTFPSASRFSYLVFQSILEAFDNDCRPETLEKLKQYTQKMTPLQGMDHFLHIFNHYASLIKNTKQDKYDAPSLKPLIRPGQ